MIYSTKTLHTSCCFTSCQTTYKDLRKLRTNPFFLPEITFWYYWSKTMQKQISKFFRPFQFCLISWHCFTNFVCDCSYFHLHSLKMSYFHFAPKKMLYQLVYTAQKVKFFIKDFICTEEILNGKLHLCTVIIYFTELGL